MARLPPQGLVPTVGLDDAPFVRGSRAAVPVAGVVCAGTRFEGLVWGRVRPDGWNATAALRRMLEGGKFLPQLHAVLLDGITLGGFNVVDLDALSQALGKPCIAFVRRAPDLCAVERALQKLPNPARRLAILRRAGEIHAGPPFVFQVRGADASFAAEVLGRVTDTGRVPEPLRLAHLIAAAVVRGESGHRA